MEDCMIEQPCGMCNRVYCNCPPEDEEPEIGCIYCGANVDEECDWECESYGPEIDWAWEANQ